MLGFVSLTPTYGQGVKRSGYYHSPNDYEKQLMEVKKAA
jgi:hypothetical protein